MSDESKYLLELEDTYAFQMGEYYYINLYPSGLVIRLESGSSSAYYKPSANAIADFSGTYMLLSPVPKTYEFLNSDKEIQQTIPYSKWNLLEDEDYYPFYYYSGSLKAFSVAYLLFVDPDLWIAKDEVSKSEIDESSYPLYKESSSTTNYYLTETLSDSSTNKRNFFTLAGSLYQYDSENKLNNVFAQPTSEYSVDNMNATTGKSSSNYTDLYKANMIDISTFNLHQRYGVLNNAFYLQRGFTEDNNGFQDKGNNLTSTASDEYTVDKPRCIFENWTNGSVFYDSSDISFLVDHYCSIVYGTLYRHSPGFQFWKSTRACTKELTDALTSEEEDTLYNTLYPGKSYSIFWPVHYTMFAEDMACGLTISTFKSLLNRVFTYYSSDYLITSYPLTSSGWGVASTTPSEAFKEESVTYTCTSKSSFNYGDIEFGEDQTISDITEIEITTPVLKGTSLSSGSTQISVVNSWSGSRKPDNALNISRSRTNNYCTFTRDLTIWKYLSGKKTARGGLTDKYTIKLSIPGLIQDYSDFILIGNSGWMSEGIYPFDTWKYVESYWDLNETYEWGDYSYTPYVSCESNGNFIGFSSTLDVTNSNSDPAVAIYGFNPN